MPQVIQMRSAQAQSAYDYCRQQRILLGLNPDPDAPVLEVHPIALTVLEGSIYPLGVRVACGEAIDKAVEKYGVDMVVRAVRGIASANGVEL